MIDINQMIEDGVEQKLIDLASMDADALKTKVAMGLVNAPIYNQFIELVKVMLSLLRVMIVKKLRQRSLMHK